MRKFGLLIIAGSMISGTAYGESLRSMQTQFLDSLATAMVIQQKCKGLHLNTEKVMAFTRILKMKQDDMLPGGRDCPVYKKSTLTMTEASEGWTEDAACTMGMLYFGPDGAQSKNLLLMGRD